MSASTRDVHCRCDMPSSESSLSFEQVLDGSNAAYLRGWQRNDDAYETKRFIIISLFCHGADSSQISANTFQLRGFQNCVYEYLPIIAHVGFIRLTVCGLNRWMIMSAPSAGILTNVFVCDSVLMTSRRSCFKQRKNCVDAPPPSLKCPATMVLIRSVESGSVRVCGPHIICACIYCSMTRGSTDYLTTDIGDAIMQLYSTSIRKKWTVHVTWFTNRAHALRVCHVISYECIRARRSSLSEALCISQKIQRINTGVCRAQHCLDQLRSNVSVARLPRLEAPPTCLVDRSHDVCGTWQTDSGYWRHRSRWL